MNNKRGQVIIYSLMLALAIIILALALAPAVVEFSATAMANSTGDDFGLNCGDGSLSNFIKAPCIVTDLLPFYFIGTLLFIGGAVIVSRVIFD